MSLLKEREYIEESLENIDELMEELSDTNDGVNNVNAQLDQLNNTLSETIPDIQGIFSQYIDEIAKIKKRRYRTDFIGTEDEECIYGIEESCGRDGDYNRDAYLSTHGNIFIHFYTSVYAYSYDSYTRKWVPTDGMKPVEKIIKKVIEIIKNESDRKKRILKNEMKKIKKYNKVDNIVKEMSENSEDI